MQRHFLLSLAVSGALALAVPVAGHAAWPEKPIKVVTGYAAGGLADITARTVVQAIEKNKLLPQPIAVINVPGAGAMIATRQVKDANPDGYTILIGNDSPLTAAALGTIDFGPEAFEFIAETSRVCVMHLVGTPTPYHSLEDLVEAAKKSPGTITEGVNFGATGHMASLRFNDMAGIETRYVQGGGSAKRAQLMAGGTIDYTLSSTLTLEKFGSLGLRGLAYMSDRRHPRFRLSGTAPA